MLIIKNTCFIYCLLVSMALTTCQEKHSVDAALNNRNSFPKESNSNLTLAPTGYDKMTKIDHDAISLSGDEEKQILYLAIEYLLDRAKKCTFKESRNQIYSEHKDSFNAHNNHLCELVLPYVHDRKDDKKVIYANVVVKEKDASKRVLWFNSQEIIAEYLDFKNSKVIIETWPLKNFKLHELKRKDKVNEGVIVLTFHLKKIVQIHGRETVVFGVSWDEVSMYLNNPGSEYLGWSHTLLLAQRHSKEEFYFYKKRNGVWEIKESDFEEGLSQTHPHPNGNRLNN